MGQVASGAADLMYDERVLGLVKGFEGQRCGPRARCVPAADVTFREADFEAAEPAIADAVAPILEVSLDCGGSQNSCSSLLAL